VGTRTSGAKKERKTRPDAQQRCRRAGHGEDAVRSAGSTSRRERAGAACGGELREPLGLQSDGEGGHRGEIEDARRDRRGWTRRRAGAAAAERALTTAVAACANSRWRWKEGGVEQ
jgi:hypothetical protein